MCSYCKDAIYVTPPYVFPVYGTDSFMNDSGYVMSSSRGLSNALSLSWRRHSFTLPDEFLSIMTVAEPRYVMACRSRFG